LWRAAGVAPARPAAESGNGSSFDFYDDSASWQAAIRIFVTPDGQWLDAGHTDPAEIDDVVDKVIAAPVGP